MRRCVLLALLLAAGSAGTAVATTIAYFGHQVGAVARERFEAARAEGR